ncbi:hypothetical protein [Rhizobacter sp. SG703]|uniref:hypothetical protein n=1 Tax=Rhizobacter sp. SG703 TaxID=2587140 RepID=UPI0014460227|nr:hypothetical protein [Rhizobacter sp. SG703]NKI93553.1 hypothetical protein [Rhizobacter sp. SG703]
MTYQLKMITSVDASKIISDADERKQRHLAMRGGHFEGGDNLHWAVDVNRNSYLFWAPQLPMDSRCTYYFFNNGRMYSLSLKNNSSGLLRPLDHEADFDSNQLREMVREAFLVYGMYGEPGGAPVLVNFEGRGVNMAKDYLAAYLQLTDPAANFTVKSLFDLIDEVSGSVKGAAAGDT